MRKLIATRFVKSTTEYLNKSRLDRIVDAEKSLAQGDGEVRTTAMASSKKLSERRVAAENKVAELEVEAESLGLVRGFSLPCSLSNLYILEKFGCHFQGESSFHVNKTVRY